MHWARECRSKYDIEGKPISGNSKLGIPQVPINKNQGQSRKMVGLSSRLSHNPALPDLLRQSVVLEQNFKVQEKTSD